MSRRFDLLVFDWDGTLMDSAAHIVACARAAFESLSLPVPEEAAVRDIIGLGLREALQTLAPGLDDAAYDAIRDAYRSRFLGAPPDVSPLFPGARGTLEALQAAGYRLAVATGKSRAGLERELARSGLASLFSATRCADETASKPDPRMLYELLTETGAAAPAAVMIGDTEYDLLMARAAGAASIAACYGVHACERLHRHGPLASVQRLSDLPAVLRALDA
jgi:phosphoglycolate phosphatase